MRISALCIYFARFVCCLYLACSSVCNYSHVVAAMSTSGASSDLYNQNKCDLCVSECLNCVLLEKQLCNASEEAESAKLIIKLLQKESDEDFPHDDRISEAINSPSDMSAIVAI